MAQQHKVEEHNEAPKKKGYRYETIRASTQLAMNDQFTP